MKIINTREVASVFEALRAPYDIVVKQGGVTHDVVRFDSVSEGKKLEFFFEIMKTPLDDRDIEILQLKKENKCLIEELESVKIEMDRLKGVR